MHYLRIEKLINYLLIICGNFSSKKHTTAGSRLRPFVAVRPMRVVCEVPPAATAATTGTAGTAGTAGWFFFPFNLPPEKLSGILVTSKVQRRQHAESSITD